MDPNSGVAASTSTSNCRDVALLSSGIVVNLLEGRWSEVRRLFDTSMKQALSENGLIWAWSEVRENAGEHLSTGLKSHWHSGGLNVVEFLLRFERQDLIVRLSLDDASRLAGLYFLPNN